LTIGSKGLNEVIQGTSLGSKLSSDVFAKFTLST